MSENQLILNEYFQMKSEEIENSNPWLVYVAEKSRTSCMKCQENHAKRFRSLDPNKPTLPIHPNCKCKYVELSKATDEMTTMRTIKIFMRGTPEYVHVPYRNIFNHGKIDLSVIENNIKSTTDPYNYGLIQFGFSAVSTDDMLDVLEKNCKPGTLGELIIVGHGVANAPIEFGNSNSRLEKMNETQINRLYNLLSPNAIIDLRFCYGANSELKENVLQNLANKLRCKIRAYGNKVSPAGIRPFPYGKVTFNDFMSTPQEKNFYPK
jgi:hypothetical protein